MMKRDNNNDTNNSNSIVNLFRRIAGDGNNECINRSNEFNENSSYLPQDSCDGNFDLSKTSRNRNEGAERRESTVSAISMPEGLTDEDWLEGDDLLDDEDQDEDELLVGFSSSRQRNQLPSAPTSPPQTTIQETSHVHFAQEIEVKFVNNLTVEYKDELWFTSRDMKKFRYESALVMRQIKSNNMSMSSYAELHIDDTSCFMGIESYLTEETVPEILMRRELLRKAVVGEQHRQLGLGIFDPVSMSNISQEQSLWARNRARLIAMIHCDQR